MGKDEVGKTITLIGSVVIGCATIVGLVHATVWYPLNNAVAAEAQARTTEDNKVVEKLDKLIEMVGTSNVILASVKTTVDINSDRIKRLEAK